MSQQQQLQLLRATRPRKQPHQRERVPRNELHERPEQRPLPLDRRREPPNLPSHHRESANRAPDEFANPTRASNQTSANRFRTTRYTNDRSKDPFLSSVVTTRRSYRAHHWQACERGRMSLRTLRGSRQHRDPEAAFTDEVDQVALARSPPSMCGAHSRKGG